MNKLSREELIELVQRITNVDGSEEEIDRYQRIVEENVPHPRLSDLIYFTKPSLSSEEIVDRALAYKPIQLCFRPQQDSH